MAYAHARRDDYRQGREQYPETYGSERQRERDYYPGEHGGYRAINYPQYGAADERYRQGNDEHYGHRQSYAPPAYGAGEFRYSGSPGLHSSRLGGDDQSRWNYPEREHHGPGLGAYGEWGGSRSWRPQPESRPQEHGRFNSPWQAREHSGYDSPPYGENLDAWRASGYNRDSGDRGSVYGSGFGDEFRGAHGGNLGQGAAGGYREAHSPHADPDYHQWRNQQIQNLDRDYGDWRRERFEKFSSDFNNWRSNRPKQEEAGAAGSSRDPSSGSASLTGAHQSSGGSTSSTSSHSGSPLSGTKL